MLDGSAVGRLVGTTHPVGMVDVPVGAPGLSGPVRGHRDDDR